MPIIDMPGTASRVPAYWAIPDGGGPHPGVVVIHDAFGLTNDARHHADWLAASGYLAIAPDLYGRGNKIVCVRAAFKALAEREGPAFEDIEAARRALVSRADCTGKVGVIGFCMGGGFALLPAVNLDFAASSVNYGEVPDDALSLLDGACPVVGSFGGRDRMLKGAAGRLQSALAANRIDHDVVEYPEANHSFLDRHDGVKGWLMARFGLGYRPGEAQDARLRILAFFGTHLRR